MEVDTGFQKGTCIIDEVAFEPFAKHAVLVPVMPVVVVGVS